MKKEGGIRVRSLKARGGEGSIQEGISHEGSYSSVVAATGMHEAPRFYSQPQKDKKEDTDPQTWKVVLVASLTSRVSP